MGFQNKFSVKFRVAFLLALFIILLASLGVFTLQRISILHDLTETLYNHPLQVSNAALRAKTGVIRMHRSMKDVALSTNQLELDLAINRVLDDEKLVYEDLHIIKKLILGEEGKDLVVKTVDMFAGWKPIRLEVELLVQEGKRDEAAQITRQKGADYVAALERQMNDLTSYAHTKADGFIANARETHQDIRDKMTWIITIVSLICLASAVVVIGGITKSVLTLQEKMAESVESGKLQQVEMVGSSEFSMLAQHFNTLVKTIEEQLWLRNNLNDLNNRLIGDLPLDELSRATISIIARTVEGCAGALYFYDAGSRNCALKSTFASLEGSHQAETFSLGEGIIGQVALEKAPVLLREIDRENARANSGTLSEAPVCIYAVPILFDKKLLAVVEIAFLSEITPARRQFIDEAVVNIGGVLNNALQNERIKNLLAESQEANSALENKSREVNEKNEELNAMNNELKAQATELQVQKNELEVKRTQVEEADRLKSEFLSNMSHELRTPLNSILSLTQLLVSRGVEKEPDMAVEYLQVIDRNGRQLLNLINDILDLTKIESGRMELFPEEFSLQGLVRDLKETIAPLAEDKDLILDFSEPEDLPIYSDREKLHQILLNFLSNAVKFTDQGIVQLTVTTTRKELVFDIMDQGIGISKEDQESIFDEFRQVDGSFTRAHEGTGLGLAISKKLAVMLRGNISVYSKIDEGSTFTLRVPRSIPGRENYPQPPVRLPATPAISNVNETPTILVIDDDGDDRSEIAIVLSDNGYQVLEAASGNEGIRIAKESQPDLISLDLMMPGIDGWEVLNMLKSDPATTTIPVIITSFIQEEETSKALGAAGCIKKPVDSEKFLSVIANVSQDSAVRSVLVIDDDLGVREYLKDILVKGGYSVDHAHNGVVALKKYDQFKPDLIILDLVMPVLDGFGFLKQLRERYDSEGTPVIVLTSKELTRDDYHQLQGTSETFTKHNMEKQLFLDTVARVLADSSAVNDEQDGQPAPSILVVDDNDVAGEQIKIVLEEHGFEVRLARDGEQGLHAIRDSIPDGIVLDLMMPEIDGFAVLEQLRSQEETATLPVLVLTAKEITAEERQRLTYNNVHQLIQKGTTDRDQLAASVSRLVQSRIGPAADGYSKPYRDTILIIEDNEDNRFTVEAIFKNEGYNIHFAENGRDGVESALQNKPNLILMDIQLPDLSGIDALKLIKDNEETSAIPVIALTAKAMRGDREEFLAEGFDDYAPKPINPDELIEKVGYWLSEKRQVERN